MPNKEKLAKSEYKSQLEEIVRGCEAIRRDTEDPQEISLAEYVKENHSISMEAFYDDLGLVPSRDTIQNIVNLPESTGLRWLIPEIFREALRLGLRKNPIYPSLIAGEQGVSQTSVTMPAINMSDAAPKKVGIAETITTGEVSFDQKSVKIHKYGRGIKVPYEVIQYVPMNLVALFLQDFGVKLAMGIDTMAITTLLNGDQSNGSDSIAVVGVATANALVYRDLFRIWARTGRLGKQMRTMVAGEDMSIELMDMMLASRVLNGENRVNINMKSPIPQNADLFVHGSVPGSQVIIVDPGSAMIKLNAQPLLVETEKLIQNQTQQTFATITTGFATIYRDSRISLAMDRLFSANGFPTWMDPSAQEQIQFD